MIQVGSSVYTGWYISPANFPDEIFRQYLSSLSKMADKDALRDAVEIPNIKKIDVAKCANPTVEWKKGNIKSLNGVSKFNIYLKEIWCGGNDLSGMDLSELLNHPSITVLSMTNANISGSVSVGSNSKLTALDMTGNKLTGISIAGGSLTEIYLGKNQFTSLDLGAAATLKEIHCYENKSLSSLAVGGNTNLEKLDCSKCSLSSLNLSKNTKLTNVSCWDNNLKTLDVSGNPDLEWLDCSVNKIIELDVSKCPTLSALVTDNEREHNSDENLDYFYSGGKQLLIDPWVKVTAGGKVSEGTAEVPEAVQKAHQSGGGEQPTQPTEPGGEGQQTTEPVEKKLNIKIKNLKVTASGNKAIKVEWTKLSKKDQKGTKIEIQVSTDKKFAKDVITKKVKSNKASIKISKLKPGKKYYIRVRVTKEADNIKYISKWFKKNISLKKK